MEVLEPQGEKKTRGKKPGQAGLLLLSGCMTLSLAVFSGGNHPGRPFGREQAEDARLAAILKRAAAYCRRLERAALDFVCLEEVREMTRHYTPQTDVYLYDYQFVRRGAETKEKRNLIAFNGKKTDIEDSRLNTFMFQYKNVLFGPVGLLGRAWQAYHEYKLIGEDAVHSTRAVVIEATPGAIPGEPHCYGRLWVKEDDGSVLKIVWDQRSLGNFASAEEWAKIHEAEPQITAYSEYGIEKNGLRFPSRSYTENAYLDKNKRKFVNGELSIFYKDYRFFTVETEVQYD